GFDGCDGNGLVNDDSCLPEFPPRSNDGTRCCGGVVEIVFIAVFIDNGTKSKS
ncbi:hypothetical protein A2U01_0088272, partial [Trifolium medium]|nr:hypothetical protein [Trifolium medium]